MIKQKKKWLSEQIWCLFYLIALICLINPIFCVIIWLDNESPLTVFVFYIFDAMANSSFIVVWLMFADNIGRKSVNKLTFYGPKILIGFATFVLTIASTTYQFPTLSPAGSVRYLVFCTRIKVHCYRSIIFSIVFSSSQQQNKTLINDLSLRSIVPFDR
jgi:hypothetical protein